MIYIAVLFVLVYYAAFGLYYRMLFSVRKARMLPLFLTLVLVAAAYILLNGYGLLVLNMPAVMLLMLLGLRFSTGMNWLQAAYGAGTSVLSAYCFRGILTGISAHVFRGRDFLSDADAYYAMTLPALFIALLFFALLRRTILPDQKLKKFLDNQSQLKFVVVYELVAAVNLMTINAGRQLTPNNFWYMAVALGACVLTLGVLVFAIYQSVQSTELLEFQFSNEMLEQQYAQLLRHYKSYQKYTKSFQEFKHDYSAMMASVKQLIRAGEGAQAIRLMDGIYDEMQEKVQVHKEYSDHVVLDALLQDLAIICDENEIKFSFQVFAPLGTDLSLLDAVRVFSNITTNAVEACVKLPVSDRFLSVASRIEQQWVVLEVVNSYDGEAVFQNGKPVTTKAQKDHHGLGLEIVNEIAEKLGGFVLYDSDTEKSSFIVRVCIPQKNNGDRPAA